MVCYTVCVTDTTDKCGITRRLTKLSRRDLVLRATSAVIITGCLAGTAVFFPAVAIGACGIVLSVMAKKKNYPRKIELTRYAYTNFEKVLHRLKAYLRGEA